MSQASAVLTVANFPDGLDTTQRRAYVYGTVAIGPTTDTYLTTGLPLTWTSLLDKSGAAVQIPTGQTTPLRVEFTDFSGTGYVYQWNQTYDSIQIFVTGTAANDALNELGEIDIPTVIHSATNIRFKAEFRKSIA